MEATAQTDERDFSVVVFGASGIAGRNVAAYLARRAGETGVRWAVAGRDPAKLERTLGEIGVTAPQTLVADVANPASLAAMASRTRVVLDLVGPYTLYGRPVIEACVANGAHYADLTGEIPFVRRTIDAFHERAATAGLKIVQVGGFEALPADLAVLLASETARQRWDEELAEADVQVTTRQPRGRLGLSDLVSGGSLQSMAEMTGAEGAELIADPAALIEDAALAAAVRQVSPISLAPRSNAQGGAIAPMTPSPFINPAVVHRTMALTAATRGAAPSPFRYREGMVAPGGAATLPLRYAAAGALSATQAGLRALTQARPSIRERAAKGMRRALPASGFGPAGERLEDWSWQLSVDARTAGGHYLRVDLDADGHPGYLTTSWMLGEAGLLLAEDGATPAAGGCLTPAAALGTAHLDRFEGAGMRFAVSS
ncbi:MAG TPA: saccharopine dehydrogenase NADP-binding domain-containing protein [Solirubrobacterales bacterium]